MALDINQLKASAPLIQSLLNIDIVPRFDCNPDIPSAVYYAGRLVYNFSSKESAENFIDSMNGLLDTLFDTEKSNIKTAAENIFK